MVLGTSSPEKKCIFPSKMVFPQCLGWWLNTHFFPVDQIAGKNWQVTENSLAFFQGLVTFISFSWVWVAGHRSFQFVSFLYFIQLLRVHAQANQCLLSDSRLWGSCLGEPWMAERKKELTTDMASSRLHFEVGPALPCLLLYLLIYCYIFSTDINATGADLIFFDFCIHINHSSRLL